MTIDVACIIWNHVLSPFFLVHFPQNVPDLWRWRWLKLPGAGPRCPWISTSSARGALANDDLTLFWERRLNFPNVVNKLDIYPVHCIRAESVVPNVWEYRNEIVNGIVIVYHCFIYFMQESVALNPLDYQIVSVYSRLQWLLSSGVNNLLQNGRSPNHHGCLIHVTDRMTWMIWGSPILANQQWENEAMPFGNGWLLQDNEKQLSQDICEN